jgi:hypothetical protein
VSIANDDGVVHLFLDAPLLPELPRRHGPPAAGLPPDTHDLRLEPDEPVQIEPPGERLQVPEHLLVSREPARVGRAGRGGGNEWKVKEAHGLARQVDAERGVEAGVRGRGAERLGRRRRGRVEPGAPHGGGALEDHGRVVHAAELARRHQARRARADDGEAEGGRRHVGRHRGGQVQTTETCGAVLLRAGSLDFCLSFFSFACGLVEELDWVLGWSACAAGVS